MNTDTEFNPEAEDNPVREERAFRTMLYYAQQQDVEIGVEGHDTVLTDLLADLLHWCDTYAVDFDHAVQLAHDHYAAETGTDPVMIVRDKLRCVPIPGTEASLTTQDRFTVSFLLSVRTNVPLRQVRYEVSEALGDCTEVVIVNDGPLDSAHTIAIMTFDMFTKDDAVKGARDAERCLGALDGVSFVPQGEPS